MRSIIPKVGNTWIVDETVLKFYDRKYWLIDIIDDDTRYLLATKLSSNRNKVDIQKCMEQASNKAGKMPSWVLTDGWKGYPDGIELAFGSETKHIVTTPFEKDMPSTNKIERWHSTLKERTKVMRGLKNAETARDFLDGWLIHYNYFRPYISLNEKTPAQEAGINFPFRNWKDVVEQPYHITARIPVKREIRVVEVKDTKPLMKPRKIRVSIKSPRITPRTPKLTSPVYEGHGLIGRIPFKGGKKIGRLLR
jgi:transposase-like protein